jgi:pimeloyl-ACP methyl ester carboxylesterase
MNRSDTSTGKRWSVRLKRIGLWLVGILLGLGVLGGLYQVIGTALDRRAVSRPGQRVDVGGYEMYLYCTGEAQAGGPTVILETGLGSTSSVWARVQPEIAKATRVCSYDRAGTGASDTSSQPRDAKHIAEELHTLLQKAGVPGPYVLVGWSYGGLYIREYAGLYGDEVAGMVLVDSSSADQWTGSPERRAQYQSNSTRFRLAPVLARLGVVRLIMQLQPDSGLPEAFERELTASLAATKDWDTQTAEFLASLDSMAQVKEARLREELPLAVLSATEHGTPPEEEELWQDWQKQMASLSTNSVQHVVEGADHASFWREPEAIKVTIAAILSVVESARSGAAS